MFKILIFTVFFLNAKAICPNESLEWQSNCYFFQNYTIGFAAAEEECVQMNGHLVSIHDAFINALLAQEGGNRYQQSTTTDFWIGLTNMMPGGNWSWMDGTSLDFVDWATGEPKNITGNNCAILSITDGSWRSDNCFKTKPYICKVDENLFVSTTTTVATTVTKYPVYAKCPFPFIYFEPSHSCYGVGNFTGPLTWIQGEQHCMAFGGHLASIHSHEEILFLTSYVFIGHDYYWIGAISDDGGISFHWSDSTPWDFNPFRSGYPKLHQSACGLMWGSDISDQLCNSTYQIICKKSL